MDGEVTELSADAASATTARSRRLLFCAPLTDEHLFDIVGRMADLETLKGELEIERRSLAMLPPASPIPKERVLDLVRRCQAAIAAAQGRIG